VVWKSAPESLLKEIEKWNPRVVLAFGQAKRRGISLETRAQNLDDFRIPDNAGQQVLAQKIIISAPENLSSTLPLEEIFESLRKEQIPAELSQSAGSFVCNHLFFHLQHALAKKKVLSGFIHLPILPEQARDGEFSMTLEQQLRALRLIIEQCS
jgi:pyroglutamyl-peptidase